MQLFHIDHIPEFIAGDGCRLRELLHPERQAIQLPYSLAYAVVDPFKHTLDHVLEQSEVYYILSGYGTMMVAGEAYPVTPGSYYEVPSGIHQWLRNDGEQPLVFLCIVAPPWSAEGEILLEVTPDML